MFESTNSNGFFRTYYLGQQHNGWTKSMEDECFGVKFSACNPVGKYLFKVSKITLEQRSEKRCSNIILLTLNRYLPTGKRCKRCKLYSKTLPKDDVRPLHYSFLPLLLLHHHQIHLTRMLNIVVVELLLIFS